MIFHVKDLGAFCGKEMFPLVFPGLFLNLVYQQSLSTSPSAAQPSGTELCSFQEGLCSCAGDSWFSGPCGGGLCESLTSPHSPAMGMDLCRSLTFKLRITPQPAKYGQGGFNGGCNVCQGRMIGFLGGAGSLSSALCAGSERGHLSLGGFMWATVHCATESRKPFQGIIRSSSQIKSQSMHCYKRTLQMVSLLHQLVSIEITQNN